MNVEMPCAVNRCDNLAIHIVHMKLQFWEQDEPGPHSLSKRWRRGEDTVNLFVCRVHRNRWVQKGAVLTNEGGLA